MTALAASALNARPRLRRVVVAAAVAVLLALVPSFVGTYQTMLLAYGLIMAIAALGFNLLLGYTGLLSFGHSAYFGVGAYTVAFLVQYFAIRSMELYLLVGLISVGRRLGIVRLSLRTPYQDLLRHSDAGVVAGAVQPRAEIVLDHRRQRRDAGAAAEPVVGGVLVFGGAEFSQFITDYYYYVLVLFTISVLVMWVIVHSPFGKALQAIRDNETRARFLGLRIRRFRWLAFLISGTFTGLAGVLWVPLNGLTTPDILYWPFSGEIVFQTLMGGFGNFTGPIVGGIVFTYLKSYAVAATEYWQFLLGAVLVVLVLVLPTGIVGAAARLVGRRRQEELP